MQFERIEKMKEKDEEISELKAKRDKEIETFKSELYQLDLLFQKERESHQKEKLKSKNAIFI